MVTYSVPVIAGDGVGPEIIAEGKKVLEAAGEVDNFDVEWVDYPHGADHYLSTGELMPNLCEIAILPPHTKPC